MLKSLKYLFSLFFLISCSSSSDPYQYKLALCAIFKNEAPWMKEWITYHKQVLGVEHFYLYNNESTDNYKEVLKPYIEEGLVDLFEWDSQNPDHKAYGPFMDIPWADVQLGAYNDCLHKKALGVAKWVAIIDIDEFIVPVQGVKSFYKLIEKAERHHKGTLSFHWRVYGTSNVDELEDGELLTEKLTWRTEDDHPWNILVKSMHRPEAIDFCLIHIAETLKPGYGARTFKPDQVRLNHYWARTGNFCAEKRKGALKEKPGLLDTLHKVEDPVIVQYVPLYKDKI